MSAKKNTVKKIGHVNLWLDSKNYNLIEMTHYTWLLSIVDLIYIRLLCLRSIYRYIDNNITKVQINLISSSI